MGKYVKNQSFGIKRPPSSYALWCAFVKANGTKLPATKRLHGKTVVNEKKHVMLRWSMMGAEEKDKFLEQQRSIVKVSRQFLAKWDKSGASPDMKQDWLEARQHQPSESPKHLRIRPFYDQHGISYLVELT
jgi:hypothetical protein